MNAKLGECTGFGPRGDRRHASSSDEVAVRWPSVEGWFPVAEEAVRTAYAACCAALALQQRPGFEDTVLFLKRRAEALLRFVETLVAESRCSDRIRSMNKTDVLAGMKQAERRLSNRVQTLLSARGLKLQMVKLLEQENFYAQASQAQLELARMENGE